MEENEKLEDFKDFDETQDSIEEIEKSLESLKEDTIKTTEQELSSDLDSSIFHEKKEIEPEIEEIKEEIKEVPQKKEIEETNKWEEIASDNSVVKKYIFYVAKEYTKIIDKMSVNERNVYINEAIQKKIDFDNQKKELNKKIRLTSHLILIVLTMIIMLPFMLLIANKAIMMTFENYKYSQDNFEKLYKQRFEKDKAYMRSVEYNKKHNIK